MPEDVHSRATLPITEPRRSGFTAYDARDPDSAFPPIEPVRPPAGAPNVLVVLLGGETNQCYPAIYEGTTPVEPDRTAEEGCLFTEDMTDKAIAWVRRQRSLMGDRPFFMLFSADETADVGYESGTTVSDRCGECEEIREVTVPNDVAQRFERDLGCDVAALERDADALDIERELTEWRLG